MSAFEDDRARRLEARHRIDSAILRAPAPEAVAESALADLNVVVESRWLLVAAMHAGGAYVVHALRHGASGMDAYETLSPREREIFQLAAEGLSSREVAERLFISPRTVETHRANLMRKLDLSDRASLIRYAVERERPPQ